MDGPTERTVDVGGGIALHVREMGRGPPAVLLHGFPDCSHTWRHQLPALADRGFHAVAPDLRGYDGSSRPGGVRAYGVGLLAADIAGLVTASARRKRTWSRTTGAAASRGPSRCATPGCCAAWPC